MTSSPAAAPQEQQQSDNYYNSLINQIPSIYNLLSNHTHKTPVITSHLLNDTAVSRDGDDDDTNSNSPSSPIIYLKCENFQKVGAFKVRGAMNAVLQLKRERGDAIKAVCTHSSGNHAQALAKAAKTFGLEAHIVMPKTAPQVKVNAVRDTYGAKVYFCEPNQQAREETCEKVRREVGEDQCEFIHPYNDERIVLGQSTCMYEFYQQLQEGDILGAREPKKTPEGELPVDVILCPIGGGGLMSGTCLASRLLTHQKLPICGVEPEAANDAQRSLESGKHVKNESPPQTIGDGLLTNLGSVTYPIIRDHVEKVYTATDEEALRAMKLVWERMKIVIEPSSAFPVAVALYNKEFKEKYAGKRIGVIISGGNVDIKKVAQLF